MNPIDVLKNPELIDQCRTYRTTWQEILDGYHLYDRLLLEPDCDNRDFYPAIYALHDAEGVIMYVGRSKDIEARLFATFGSVTKKRRTHCRVRLSFMRKPHKIIQARQQNRPQNSICYLVTVREVRGRRTVHVYRTTVATGSVAITLSVRNQLSSPHGETPLFYHKSPRFASGDAAHPHKNTSNVSPVFRYFSPLGSVSP